MWSTVCDGQHFISMMHLTTYCVFVLCVRICFCVFVKYGQHLISTMHLAMFCFKLQPHTPVSTNWIKLHKDCIPAPTFVHREGFFWQNCIWTFETMSVPIITVVMTLGQHILTDDRMEINQYSNTTNTSSAMVG